MMNKEHYDICCLDFNDEPLLQEHFCGTWNDAVILLQDYAKCFKWKFWWIENEEGEFLTGIVRTSRSTSYGEVYEIHYIKDSSLFWRDEVSALRVSEILGGKIKGKYSMFQEKPYVIR